MSSIGGWQESPSPTSPRTSAFRLRTSRQRCVPPSPPQPEFFVDRSLGRGDVPDGLRVAGLSLRRMVDVYGVREEQVRDVEWLERAGREGWVVLTKDKRIRRRFAENVLFFDAKPAKRRRGPEALGLRPADKHALHAEDHPLKRPTSTSSSPATIRRTGTNGSQPGARRIRRSLAVLQLRRAVKRDKLNLDIFWLKDKSLEDCDDLPDVLAQEIADDLQAALDQFAAIAAEPLRARSRGLAATCSAPAVTPAERAPGSSRAGGAA